MSDLANPDPYFAGVGAVAGEGEGGGGSGIMGWFEREFGAERTLGLKAENLNGGDDEQIQALQELLSWFRSRFPYYYDRCDRCGTSARDERLDREARAEEEEEEILSSLNVDRANSTALSLGEEDDVDDGGYEDGKEEEYDDDEDDGSSFLGYVYPSPPELLGLASRTELYRCRCCESVTRFPRYNSARSIASYGRGRCGEYSMLLYRILRALGHDTRWVVDWGDHVWAEVRLKGRWIHLDPCEAAVDNPLLYQSWGKRQTYIVAYQAPPLQSMPPFPLLPNQGDATKMIEEVMATATPLIEDVTETYTSDSIQTIQGRREETEGAVRMALEEAKTDLSERLGEVISRWQPPQPQRRRGEQTAEER